MFKFDQVVQPSNLKMISTEILKPIQIDDNQATFVLRNTGYLDRKTRLTLSAVATPVGGQPAAAVNGVSYPMSCGVASLIRSAVLKVSGKIIAQNNAVGDVIAMKSNFEDVEGRNNVLRARLGVHNSWTHSRVGVNNERTAAAYAGYGNGAAQLNGRDYEGFLNSKQGKIVPDKINWTPEANYMEASTHEAFQGSNYGLTNDKETTGKFYLSLEQLFPWLYTAVGREVLQLPLMYIKEEIQLVIQFSRNGQTPMTNHRGLNNAEHLGRNFKVDIIKEECNLLIDYLHYFDNSATAKEIMGDGLVLNYADIETINLSMQGLPACPAIKNKSKSNFNLGLVGKNIRQMYLISKKSIQVEEDTGTIPIGTDLLPQVDGATLPAGMALNATVALKALPVSQNGDPIRLTGETDGAGDLTHLYVGRSPQSVNVGDEYYIIDTKLAAGGPTVNIPKITIVAGNIKGGNSNRIHQKQNRLNGRYCSPALSNFTDGTSYQVNINGKNLYVNPVSTVNESLMRLSSAWGTKFQNPMSTYCLYDSITDDLDVGHAKFGNNQDRELGSRFDEKSIISSVARINGHLLTDLHGCNNYIGIDLQKFIMSQSGAVARMDLQGSGTEVVNAPVFLEINRDIPKDHINDNRELLVVCLVEKSIIMKSGSVSIL